MAGEVNVRGVHIGVGLPKICVPVLGNNAEEIMASARQAAASGADLIEWRADFFLAENRPETLESILEEIRKTVGELPLLFTIRTVKEGGAAALSGEEYEQACRIAVTSGKVDLIDIEMSQGEALAGHLIAAAREAGVKTVVSSHDFNSTPEKEDMVELLLKMKEWGADLPKLAVMPGNREELLRLLSATQEVCENRRLGPVITMSMGRIGMPSRCLGEMFGSALTFASAGQVSAPGQIPVEELRILIALFHKYSGNES